MSGKLTKLMLLCLFLFNIASATPAGTKRPTDTNPSLNEGSAGEQSQPKRTKHALEMVRHGGDGSDYVLEAFIPDTSTEKVTYEEIYQMTVERWKYAFTTLKCRAPIVDGIHGEYPQAFLLAVAHYKGLGYAVSSGPHGEYQKEIVSDLRKIRMLSGPLGASVAYPHVEDNLYKILIQEALKAGKLTTEALHFPDEAAVTVAIHGLFADGWSIVTTEDREGTKRRTTVLAAKNPFSREFEKAPCQTSRKPSCKNIADQLHVTTVLGPPRQLARPITPPTKVLPPPQTPETGYGQDEWSESDWSAAMALSAGIRETTPTPANKPTRAIAYLRSLLKRWYL